MIRLVQFSWGVVIALTSCLSLQAQQWGVYLLEVPNYDWQAGCFGSATGNLMGFWDRNGMAGFYTGPTAGGVAPLSNYPDNTSIRALWISERGVDGRPSNQWGHMDDYYDGYSLTWDDRYVRSNRTEHLPDCIGDFIGLSQKRWTNMNDECDGNIDAYSFVYWDTNGDRRINFTPPSLAGMPARDIQSGLRAWTQYRGYNADVFTQLTDFNRTIPRGKGFSYQDLKSEIDAGYPVLLFLQSFTILSQIRGSILRGNPDIHGMLAYGYWDDPEYGDQWVYYRTSWGGGGDNGVKSLWNTNAWQAYLPVRGVIGYHPLPQIRSIEHANGKVTLTWEGPNARLVEAVGGGPATTNVVHHYQVERAMSLTAPKWVPVGGLSSERSVTLQTPEGETVFYRIRLVAGAVPSS